MVCPVDVVGRIWDCYLITGEAFVYRVAVGKRAARTTILVSVFSHYVAHDGPTRSYKTSIRRRLLLSAARTADWESCEVRVRDPASLSSVQDSPVAISSFSVCCAVLSRL